MDTVQNDNLYVMQTYGRFPLELVRGEGAVAYDKDGKQYIDFTSGIGVNALGFCDEGWKEAVIRQLSAFQHTSNLFYTAPQANLARLLCEKTGFDKAFFCNSGTEANEAAIKLARKASFDKYGAGRHVIVALINSFHGRTMGALSATGQPVLQHGFAPMLEGFRFVERDDLDAMQKALQKDVAAVILEPVQGESGVNALDFAYLQQVRQLCDALDICLIADEVQSGTGRTGRFLALEHAGIQADVTTLAKGLGAGLPIGAVLARGAYADVLKKGEHGTTFGGNPVVCAGACALVERVGDKALLENVAQKGVIIRGTLEKMPQVKSVSGLGMMVGIDIGGLDARAIAEACIQNGLLVLTAKQKLRLLPPLNIPESELEAGLKILGAVLLEAASQAGGEK